MTYTCGDQAVKNLQNINHANRGHILQECLGSSDLHIYTPCHHLSVSYQDGRPGCLHFQNVVWWEALHWLEALGHVSLAGCPPPQIRHCSAGKVRRSKTAVLYHWATQLFLIACMFVVL